MFAGASVALFAPVVVFGVAVSDTLISESKRLLFPPATGGIKLRPNRVVPRMPNLNKAALLALLFMSPARIAAVRFSETAAASAGLIAPPRAPRESTPNVAALTDVAALLLLLLLLLFEAGTISGTVAVTAVFGVGAFALSLSLLVVFAALLVILTLSASEACNISRL